MGQRREPGGLSALSKGTGTSRVLCESQEDSGSRQEAGVSSLRIQNKGLHPVAYTSEMSLLSGDSGGQKCHITASQGFTLSEGSMEVLERKGFSSTLLCSVGEACELK